MCTHWRICPFLQILLRRKTHSYSQHIPVWPIYGVSPGTLGGGGSWPNPAWAVQRSSIIKTWVNLILMTKSNKIHTSGLLCRCNPRKPTSWFLPERVQKTGLNIKVVKRPGKSVKRTPVKSNPFKRRGCGQDRCQVWALGGDVDCKARGIYYKIWCDGADEQGNPCVDINYEGETSHSTEEKV